MLVKMRELMATPEARAAAVEATLDGLPAMAGVDVFLHEALGEAYRRNEAAVPTAQTLTAELMSQPGLHRSWPQGPPRPLRRPLRRILEAGLSGYSSAPPLRRWNSWSRRRREPARSPHSWR